MNAIITLLEQLDMSREKYRFTDKRVSCLLTPTHPRWLVENLVVLSAKTQALHTLTRTYFGKQPVS